MHEQARPGDAAALAGRAPGLPGFSGCAPLRLGERAPVLVIHPTLAVRRRLACVLATLRRPVVTVETIAEGLDQLALGPALAFVEHAPCLEPDGKRFLAESSARGCASVVLVGAETPLLDVGLLLQSAAFGHLVVDGGLPSLAETVLVTALKLLRRDVFGIEKYLAWGVEPVRLVLETAGARRALVASLHDDLIAQGWGRRVASRAAHTADELLSNAVFNAPVDAEGKHPRAPLSRTEDWPLTGQDRVELSYACDGRFVALAVEDRYGSLDPLLGLAGLARHFTGQLEPRDGVGGAGIGLALACRHVDQLIFNIAPETRTEVIGLIDVRTLGRPGSEVPSVNFFVFRSGE